MSFKNDLDYSQEQQEKLKELYRNEAFEGRFTFVEKGDGYKSQGSLNIQTEFGIDTIFQTSDKESVLVEEKFRKQLRDDIVVETLSCSVEGREKDGWIHTSKADFLNYVMDDGDGTLHCYIMSMKELREFFFKNENRYPKRNTTQINRTVFCPIPIKDLEQNIQIKHFTVSY